MKKLNPLIVSLLFILLLPNCEELLTDEVTEEERAEAQALVEEADKQIFSDLKTISDDAEENIEDSEIETIGTTVQNSLDVSTSYNKYKKALELDPENTGANFGAGYMEVAMATQDELLKQTLNDWAECFSDLGMFQNEKSESAIIGNRSAINKNDFKMGIPQTGRAFFSFDMISILNYVPIVTSPEYVLQRNTYDCPEIESLQVLLEEVFLTRITTAINRLNKVVGTGFVFTITPAMWETLLGDNDQKRMDLDDTEIYLMKAFLHYVRSMIYGAVTYNVNFPYYDFIEAEGWVDTDYDWQWLAQNSDFLTIRSGKGQSLASSHTDLNDVINSVESAWTFLKTDTDINNDLILLEDVQEAEDEMAEEIDRDVNAALDEARKILNEDYAFTVPGPCISMASSYEDNQEFIEECEPGFDITMNIKNLFTNPPQNLKEILPAYTLTTGTCEYRDWDYDSKNYSLNLTVENSGFVNGNSYNFYASCGWNQWDENNLGLYVDISYYNWSESENLKEILENEIKAACEEIISSYGEVEVNYFSFSFSSSGTINNNQISITENVYYNIETIQTGNWGCPKLSWNANTCDQWKNGWDVTLGGLFPYMTTEKFFGEDMFELDEETCEEILTGGELDF